MIVGGGRLVVMEAEGKIAPVVTDGGVRVVGEASSAKTIFLEAKIILTLLSLLAQ